MYKLKQIGYIGIYEHNTIASQATLQLIQQTCSENMITLALPFTY